MQSAKQLVAQLEKKKVAVRSPADVVQALPEVLPLPEPLAVESALSGETSKPGWKSEEKAKKGVDSASHKLYYVNYKMCFESGRV